jgi:predicted metal-dependent hydrolase
MAFDKKLFSTSQTWKAHIEIDGEHFPVEVVLDKRSLSARFALTGKKAILRVPAHMQPCCIEDIIPKFEQWVRATVAQRPDLHRSVMGRSYTDGSTLQVFGREYVINIREEARNGHRGRIEGRNIQLTLAIDDSPVNRRKSIKHLISRLVASDCAPEFVRRVQELNFLFFQKPINGVSFKYNQSNWGSCSSNKNLNFSTRLLFAPAEVIDYIIIHELAHLTHMDHSDQFWALVENAMPEYRRAEGWLKQNGHLCVF